MNRFYATHLFTTFAKLLSIFFLVACSGQTRTTNQELIIFHAGSLSVPFQQVIKAFNQEYPEIKVLTEASGSRDCARKITDLKKDCDVMASADYTVIDQLLIPDHASWNIKFASNEMVIVYHEKSKYSDRIDSTNWFEILLNKDVKYGRSDPNSDPCGYRTVLVSKLAEKYYEIPGFTEKLLEKDQKFIRPKETDLLALLEINTLDYVFIYRSVAVQHHLNFVELPSKINLENPGYAEYYSQATVRISGKKMGEFVTKSGEPMIYGVTITKDAVNQENAMKFAKFLLSEKGMKIMEENGQPSIVPSYSSTFDQIPVSLKNFALEK